MLGRDDEVLTCAGASSLDRLLITVAILAKHGGGGVGYA